MSAASGAGDRADLIGEYLATLRASLPGGPAETDLIVAEAEDHLRETVAAALAAGMTGREAQEAAISAFGPVRAVVQAHQATPGHLLRGRTPAAVLGDLTLAAWKLGSLALVATGASGLLMARVNHALGRVLTGQAFTEARFGWVSCAYLRSNWPHALNCVVAQGLNNVISEAALRVILGIIGVVAFAAYAVTRRLLRRRGRGPAVLLAGYFPALAAAVFGAGALTLYLAQITGHSYSVWVAAQVTVWGGEGPFLDCVIVATAVALGYALRSWWARRRLLSGRSRRLSAR